MSAFLGSAGKPTSKMSEVRVIAISLLAVIGMLAIGPSASLAEPAQPHTDAVVVPQTNETSMDGQVSSFMHASSGQADEAVESGMWNAAFENASNKSAVVDSRADAISNRLDELQEQKQQLIEARQNDAISDAEYQARMSDIVGRMAALNRSIDQTEHQARASGADLTDVEQLRSEASNTTGSELSNVAESFADGPPDDVSAKQDTAGGPPDSTGPPNDNINSPDRGNNTSVGNGVGPNGNNGVGPNGSDDEELETISDVSPEPNAGSGSSTVENTIGDGRQNRADEAVDTAR